MKAADIKAALRRSYCQPEWAVTVFSITGTKLRRLLKRCPETRPMKP